MLRRVLAASGLASALLFVPVPRADAEITTILCKYRAPQSHTVPFRLDLSRQVLIEGPDLFDGDTTTDAPLTITTDTIAWTANDGARMTLDRSTMILAYTYNDIGPVDSFDCAVAHKQL